MSTTTLNLEDVSIDETGRVIIKNPRIAETLKKAVRGGTEDPNQGFVVNLGCTIQNSVSGCSG